MLKDHKRPAVGKLRLVENWEVLLRRQPPSPEGGGDESVHPDSNSKKRTSGNCCGLTAQQDTTHRLLQMRMSPESGSKRSWKAAKRGGYLLSCDRKVGIEWQPAALSDLLASTEQIGQSFSRESHSTDIFACIVTHVPQHKDWLLHNFS